MGAGFCVLTGASDFVISAGYGYCLVCDPKRIDSQRTSNLQRHEQRKVHISNKLAASRIREREQVTSRRQAVEQAALEIGGSSVMEYGLSDAAGMYFGSEGDDEVGAWAEENGPREFGKRGDLSGLVNGMPPEVYATLIGLLDFAPEGDSDDSGDEDESARQQILSQEYNFLLDETGPPVSDGESDTDLETSGELLC